jgi:Fe-S-cluster-containing hydrogenase component 2
LCPIGAIEIYNDIPQVCDLCGGSPRCVIACDMGAIQYVADESQTISLAPYKERSKSKNPAQKRYEYAVEGGERLRAQWFKDRR